MAQTKTTTTRKKKTQKFSVPIRLEAGVRKKKTFYLNLNAYKQWHFQESNQLKKLFKIKTLATIRELKPVDKAEITYKVYYPTAREFDLDNIGSVISKFTNDVLTEVGIIEDDNYKILTKITFVFGGIDKENPRCEVTLKEV